MGRSRSECVPSSNRVFRAFDTSRMAAPRGTLVCDGSSDQLLRPLLRWLCAQHGQPEVEIEWANLYSLPERPPTLRERIERAVDLYPCDVVFIHRDAERQGYDRRASEIDSAIQGLSLPASIPVVPVRMTEAWLLSNEGAIRFAAGNPAGQVPLGLPPPAQLENTPDPKAVLHQALRVAAELSVRRRRRLRTHQAAHVVAERTEDFTPLRVLAAFRALESRVANLMGRWDSAAERFGEDDAHAG